MTELIVIERQGVRLLTTAALAEKYETDTNTLVQNFKRNKERYEEGKHYFCLKGEELRAFKSEMTECHFAKNLNILYLWTERGCLLHAKSLNTDKAWETYDKLVETYFRAQKAQTVLQNLSPQTQAMINLEIRQNNLESRVNDIERRMDGMTAEPEPAPALMKSEPKKWSEREKDYLRKAYALGQSDVEIAADLNRTIMSISNERRKLGLVGKTSKRWTDGEDKKLIRLHNKRVSYADIAAVLDKTADSVGNRLKLLRKKGLIRR